MKTTFQNTIHGLCLSASAAGLATALRSAGMEGTVVELSWYGDKRIDVPLQAASAPLTAPMTRSRRRADRMRPLLLRRTRRRSPGFTEM